MPPWLVLNRQLLHKNALKSHSLRKNLFMARLERIQPPPQFTLGFTELEWLGYKAWYREGVARGQLLPDSSENHSQSHESQAETLKRGPTLKG
jgi:hypothetical protein